MAGLLAATDALGTKKPAVQMNGGPDVHSRTAEPRWRSQKSLFQLLLGGNLEAFGKCLVAEGQLKLSVALGSLCLALTATAAECNFDTSDVDSLGAI